MAKYQIVASEPVRNIVRNPSAEDDLVDWTAQGSAIARTTDHARFETYSVEVVTNGAALYEGVNVRSFPNTSGEIYAGSVYVKGEGQVRVRIRDHTNGDEYVSDPFTLSLTRWIRISDVIGQTGINPSDDLRLHVETVAIEVLTFYVDGVMIENNPYSTTYVDGEQPGCRWNIAKHASVSDRLSSERSGGRYIDLDEEGLGLYATITAGIGMPSLRHNIQGRALQAGVEYQSTKVLPRIIQITLWIQNPKSNPGALERIHEVRQELLDLLKPDRVIPEQHFRLRYNGGSVPMDIDCVYEGGLEFDGDLRNQMVHSLTIRAISNDPFWFEDNQQTAVLDPNGTLLVQNGLIAKINREWDNLGFANNYICALVIGPDGYLYAGGAFTVIGGVGANRIARFDGTNWYPLGTGLDNICNSIAFGPDGSVYAAGDFTSAGGVADTIGVAQWDGTNWISVGGGLNNNANSIAFAPDGSFYITGDFTLCDPAGGAPVTANYIARWSGTTWYALVDTGAGGGNGFDAAGLVVTVASDGLLYAGGTFTAAGAVADTQSIALWNLQEATWNSIGNANGDVYALAITIDGIVYAGGDFTTIGGVTATRAASWNGSTWSALAGGADAIVRAIFIDEDGLTWFVGDFTEVSDTDSVAIPNTLYVAIWDGIQWIPAQFTVHFSHTRMRTVVINGEDMYFGGEGAQAIFFIPGTTIIDSYATAESYPIIMATRTIDKPGTGAVLILIMNETSRKKMKLTYELAAGEVVEIDFRPGKRTVTSSLYSVSIDIAEALRNRLGEVIPGSDFATWSLVPGENVISFYIQPIVKPQVTATMRWQPLHWSADAGVI